MYKLLVFDRNTLNYTNICKLFLLDWNTWYQNCKNSNETTTQKWMYTEHNFLTSRQKITLVGWWVGFIISTFVRSTNAEVSLFCEQLFLFINNNNSGNDNLPEI